MPHHSPTQQRSVPAQAIQTAFLRPDRLQASALDHRIAKTVAFMKRNLASGISVAALARMVNLSRSHYAQLFKHQMHYPVLEYFIRLKMRRAADLIQDSDEQMKQIAKSLGFRDPLYFSRQFRRVYGRSPRSFRSLGHRPPVEPWGPDAAKLDVLQQ